MPDEGGAVAELPESVDRDILQGRTIAAIVTIRKSQECSLHDAVDIYAERYRELHPAPDTAPPQRPGPRVLRFEPDGSLVVSEDRPDDQPPAG
jgi:hypothetical protein